MSAPITDEDQNAAHVVMVDVVTRIRADDYRGASVAIAQLLADSLAPPRERVANQQHELANLQEAQRAKNLALDALHWVWCDGGCGGGVHRWDHSAEVTEEVVSMAERYAGRLRRWLGNRDGRIKYREAGDTEKAALVAEWSKRPAIDSLRCQLADAEARNATVRAEAFREALTLARAAVTGERLEGPNPDDAGDKAYGEAVLDCLAAIGRIPGAPPPETPLPAYALVSAAKVAQWLRLRAEKYIKGASARWLAECLLSGTWEHDLARLAPAATPPAAPTEGETP